MGTTQTTRVSILGSEYTLKGTSDPETITEVARFVDAKLRQARARSDQPNDIARVAILTSLNIAYELFETRADALHTREQIEANARQLVERLDACMRDAPAHDAATNGSLSETAR